MNKGRSFVVGWYSPLDSLSLDPVSVTLSEPLKNSQMIISNLSPFTWTVENENAIIKEISIYIHVLKVYDTIQ